MSDDPNIEWTVYFDYDIESMTYTPAKVVLWDNAPWNERSYSTCLAVEAQDELDAFRRSIEIMERIQWTL